MMKRREFVQTTGASALALFVSGCVKRQTNGRTTVSDTGSQGQKESAGAGGFGPLITAKDGLLDLPEGFTYCIVQTAGDALSDGYQMPQQPDGMACFEGPKGEYVLLRNHELGNRAFMDKRNYLMSHFSDEQVPSPNYAKGAYGGVTRVVIDAAALRAELQQKPGQKSKAITRSNFALAGTELNCAGGQTPQGWVTCEESENPGHGYAFLTKPTDDALTKPRRITSWGRFPREAIVLDQKTGIAYMTEDRHDGLFYRHVPDDPKRPMGKGTLEALAIKGLKTTHVHGTPRQPNTGGKAWPKNQSWQVHWVRIPDPSAKTQSCRAQGAMAGATQFMRGEGITNEAGTIWFTASLGGPAFGGQIFKYIPGTSKDSVDTLRLEYEVTDRSVLSCPDNLVMAPWGDLVMAEDNYASTQAVTHQYIRGMTNSGEIYDIARNRNSFANVGKAGAEFTGACFSPDGAVLFVNLQTPENVTVAIAGPWQKSV